MSTNTRVRTALTGPITGQEPALLKDLPVDNLVGAVTALASEVYILRERLAFMEAELTRRRVLARDAVETFEPTPEEMESIQRGLDAFIERFWSELGRDTASVSHIDPGVETYLGDQDS